MNEVSILNLRASNFDSSNTLEFELSDNTSPASFDEYRRLSAIDLDQDEQSHTRASILRLDYDSVKDLYSLVVENKLNIKVMFDKLMV